MSRLSVGDRGIRGLFFFYLLLRVFVFWALLAWPVAAAVIVLFFSLEDI